MPNRAADDVDFISKRIEELRKEREENEKIISQQPSEDPNKGLPEGQQGPNYTDYCSPKPYCGPVNSVFECPYYKQGSCINSFCVCNHSLNNLDQYERIISVPCDCDGGCNNCDWTGTVFRVVGGRALPPRRVRKIYPISPEDALVKAKTTSQASSKGVSDEKVCTKSGAYGVCMCSIGRSLGLLCNFCKSV